MAPTTLGAPGLNQGGGLGKPVVVRPLVAPPIGLPATSVHPLTEQPELPYNPELRAPVITIYGDTKVGKSALIAETFPLALFISRPGGMLPAITHLGLDPQHGLTPLTRRVLRDGVEVDWTAFVFEHHIRSLSELRALPPTAAALGFTALGVDDISLAAKTYDRDLSQSRADGGLGEKGRAIFKRFSMIGNALNYSTEAVRFSTLPIAISGHVRHPEMVPDGMGAQRAVPGGPKFPSRNLTDDIVYESDVVAYMHFDPQRRGFSAVLDFTNVGYRGGDRLSAFPKCEEANLRGPMVFKGYYLPRYPGLEWQDAVMVHVADRLQNGDDFEAVVHETIRTVSGTYDKHPDHVKWGIRDGRGLYYARLRAANSYINDFLGESAAQAAASSVVTVATPPPQAAKPAQDEDDD